MVAWYWLVLALAGGSLGILGMAMVIGGSWCSHQEEDEYIHAVHLRPTVR